MRDACVIHLLAIGVNALIGTRVATAGAQKMAFVFAPEDIIQRVILNVNLVRELLVRSVVKTVVRERMVFQLHSRFPRCFQNGRMAFAQRLLTDRENRELTAVIDCELNDFLQIVDLKTVINRNRDNFLVRFRLFEDRKPALVRNRTG